MLQPARTATAAGTTATTKAKNHNYQQAPYNFHSNHWN